MEDKVGLGGGRVVMRDSGDLRPLQDVNVFPDLHNQLALLPQPFDQSCRLSTHPCVALAEGSTRSSYKSAHFAFAPNPIASLSLSPGAADWFL